MTNIYTQTQKTFNNILSDFNQQLQQINLDDDFLVLIGLDKLTQKKIFVDKNYAIVTISELNAVRKAIQDATDIAKTDLAKDFQSLQNVYA